MGSSEYKLFVGGLDYNTRKGGIVQYFKKFGEIDGICLPRDQDSSQSRGYCFLVYKDAASVDRVLTEKPHVIDNHRVEVRLAYGKALDRTKNRVFLGGLRDSHTREALEQYFSQFGAVADVEIFADRTTGKCRGFAFVLFEESSVVNQVLAQRIFTIGGYSCEAKPAVSSNRDREYRERRVRPSRNQPNPPICYGKTKETLPFSFFQNTPPPHLFQHSFYGDAPLPYCVPVHQNTMILPPFQHVAEQPIPTPIIYQEFPDGISYESLYYAYTTPS